MGHAGIDTSIYPGDAVMTRCKAETNLEWCGFYLGPAPSHPNASWMTKRSQLVSMGWGLAPIYVGQQQSGPGSHHLDAAHGDTDGADACALARRAEFPAGSVVYLDIETGGPLSAAAVAYLKHWAERVQDGGYIAGAYLSHTSAASALKAVPELKLWVFKIKHADMGGAKNPPFRQAAPSGSGVAGAIAWQWAQNCKIPVNGNQLVVDLNVANTTDPSQVLP